MTVALDTMQTVMLASVRVIGFLVVAPPFSGKDVPSTVKVALGLAVGMAVSPRLAPLGSDTTGVFVASLVLQAVLGLALGFAVQLVLSAVQMAGAVLDQFGGFSLGQAYDPMNQTSGAQLSQFYGFLAIVLLFLSDGYQVVLRGLVRTFDAVPLDAGLSLSRLAAQLTAALSGLFSGALQIAGPLVLVLFLTDLGLGLLTKVAPMLNAFALGYPLKILITLLATGFALLALPHVVTSLADRAAALMEAVTGR